MSLLDFFLLAVTLLVLLPVAVLFTEVLFAISNRSNPPAARGERLRLAVIMPAHNEASVIAAALQSVRPQLEWTDRMLVVADNCSDETANIAIKEGAEVIVRNDLTHRGKGYALDFGVRHLRTDPTSVVIFLDADCRVAPDSISQLARKAAQMMRPVQALYLMRAPRSAEVLTRIGQFAWTVKNHVRPLGLHKLGLPCQLMGTGMAFPWSCIESAELATDHIVEDLKLGIDLARAGTPPLFVPEALVTSDFPASREGMREQRTRWEHGHIGTILGEVPSLILDAFRSKDIKLLAFALDLSVPPLALLSLVTCVVWSASAFLYVFAKVQLPLVIATSAAALLAVSVLLSWARYGRNIVSLGDLLLAAPYAIWKIPLYARFLVARQKRWVRSKRDEDPK